MKEEFVLAILAIYFEFVCFIIYFFFGIGEASHGYSAYAAHFADVAHCVTKMIQVNIIDPYSLFQIAVPKDLNKKQQNYNCDTTLDKLLIFKFKRKVFFGF